MDQDDYIPFCGTPPIPSELLTRWTLDPLLLGGLVVVLLAGWRHASGSGARRRFVMGWGVATLLFVSPICALSMALFSARVAQHLALTLIAAPLLTAAVPRLSLPPVPTAVVFAVLFWVWHAPAPYAATLNGDFAYWAMHLSLLSAAVLFWVALRDHIETQFFACMAALAGTAAQMTTLAAVLVVSEQVWHGFHIATTAPYGIGPMQDQALAGALMWVAGGALMMVLAWRAVRRFVVAYPA